MIDNAKSNDARALIARIDEAMTTGLWADAQATWAYIKSRQSQLRTDLSPAEIEKLHAFILEERNRRIYLLKKGALEAYLPDGYRSKELDKLIDLVGRGDFWEKLTSEAQTELKEIALFLM